MRRIAHIARETIRHAVRSRLAGATAALLVLVLAILPQIAGRGAPVEEVRRIALTWTLGLSAILLSAVTLWTGCGGIATEREEGTWSALSVTSAPRLSLWLGKWAGLVALDAAALAIVLVGVALGLRLRAVPSDRLQPYERISPTPASLRDNARRLYANALARGILAPDAEHTAEDWIDRIVLDLKTSPLSLSSGESFLWDFPVPHRYAGSPFPSVRPYLSVILVSPYGSAAEIAGRVTASADGREVASREVAPDDSRDIRLELPDDALRGQGLLQLRLDNTGSEEAPAALFHPTEDAALFVPAGSLATNLLRAGLVLLALLATLAAIGLSCGSLFSRPVAIFAATGVVIVGLLSHAVPGEGTIADPHDPVAAAQPGHAHAMRVRRLLSALSTLTAPIAEAAPLDRTGDGLLVPARPVRQALLLNGLGIPLVLGILSAAVLRRRENEQA